MVFELSPFEVLYSFTLHVFYLSENLHIKPLLFYIFTYALPPQKRKTSFDLTISITVNIYVTTTVNGVLKLNPFCFKRKGRLTLVDYFV